MSDTPAQVAVLRIAEGGLDDPRVIDLLEVHVGLARTMTAPGFSFALEQSELRAPDIRFFSGWEDEQLMGVGALRTLTPDHGEVKSMHTAQHARRRGVGGAMLRHLVAQARALGMSRLSLETGTHDYYQPAVALYLANGFEPCGPFGDYVPSPDNRFFTRTLT